jgi:hypothetical protein
VDDVELTKTICAALGGIPGWEWRPTGPAYTSAEVGVFYGAIGPKPDRAVGVRVYGATDERDGPAWRRVQIRFRGADGNAAGADELAGQAFPVLTELSRQGGISGIRRESVAPLGADGNRREQRTDNYIIILDNQEALT